MIAVSTERQINQVLRDLKGRTPVHLYRGKRIVKVWAVDQDTTPQGGKQWAFSMTVDSDESTEHVFHTGTGNTWTLIEGAKRSFYRALYAALLGHEVEVGLQFGEYINQNDRDCEVLVQKRTRFRIEYEMPNAGMVEAWRYPAIIRHGVWYYVPVRAGTYHSV